MLLINYFVNWLSFFIEVVVGVLVFLYLNGIFFLFLLIVIMINIGGWFDCILLDGKCC